MAKPGEPLIVKLLGHGPATGDGTPGSTNADSGGAGFVFGVDDLLDPGANDPLIDQGANSQLRILGIGGDQTTGQQRVPVILTSIHDSTVGTTVRGVKLFTVIDGDTTAPKAGDGGLIFIGGNALPSYNAFDIRQGSTIDNADISYITRIELQGGGFLSPAEPNLEITGQQLTISDTNLSSFSDDGVLSESYPEAIDFPSPHGLLGRGGPVVHGQ